MSAGDHKANPTPLSYTSRVRVLTEKCCHRTFVHGHTYQGHPVTCAAALEVQKIIREEKLVQNVSKMGALLSARLIDLLANHPNVGDIRGRGLFWGIEFVKDKATKEPFPSSSGVAQGVAELGLTKPYYMAVYPGSGTNDGVNGDHIIISPPYNITPVDVETIATTVQTLVTDYFASNEVEAKVGMLQE